MNIDPYLAKKGYTALEILLVIAILGIFIGIIFLSYRKYLERTEITALKTSVNSTSTTVMICSSLNLDFYDPQYYTDQPICDESEVNWPDLTHVASDAVWRDCETEQDGDHFRYCIVHNYYMYRVWLS